MGSQSQAGSGRRQARRSWHPSWRSATTPARVRRASTRSGVPTRVPEQLRPRPDRTGEQATRARGNHPHPHAAPRTADGEGSLPGRGGTRRCWVWGPPPGPPAGGPAGRSPPASEGARPRPRGGGARRGWGRCSTAARPPALGRPSPARARPRAAGGEAGAGLLLCRGPAPPAPAHLFPASRGDIVRAGRPGRGAMGPGQPPR